MLATTQTPPLRQAARGLRQNDPRRLDILGTIVRSHHHPNVLSILRPRGYLHLRLQNNILLVVRRRRKHKSVRRRRLAQRKRNIHLNALAHRRRRRRKSDNRIIARRNHNPRAMRIPPCDKQKRLPRNNQLQNENLVRLARRIVADADARLRRQRARRNRYPRGQRVVVRVRRAARGRRKRKGDILLDSLAQSHAHGRALPFLHPGRRRQRRARTSTRQTLLVENPLLALHHAPQVRRSHTIRAVAANPLQARQGIAERQTQIPMRARRTLVVILVAKLQKHARTNPVARRHIHRRTPARTRAVQIAIELPGAEGAVQAPALPRPGQAQIQTLQHALLVADAASAPFPSQCEVVVQAAVKVLPLRIHADAQARVLALKVIIEKQRSAPHPIPGRVGAIHHAKIDVGAQLFRAPLPED